MKIRSWLDRFLDPIRTDFISSRKLRGNPAFLQYIAFGFSPKTKPAQTYLEQVEQYRRDALKRHGEKELRTASQPDLNAILENLLTEISLDGVRPLIESRQPITMGLTAGYDSRSIFTILRRHHVPVQSYTFGQEGFIDYDFIGILAARLGFHNEWFDTSRLHWSLAEYEQSFETFPDYPISPRVIVEQKLAQRHSARGEIHGYMNGNLTGATTPKHYSADWETALQVFCKKNNPFSLQDFLGQKAVYSLLPSTPLIHADHLPYDQQLDIGFRLLQRIRPAGNKTTHVILPFEDGRWVGFWLTRPIRELRGQKMYLSFLRSLNAPEFLDIAESNSTHRSQLRLYHMEMIKNSKQEKSDGQEHPAKVLPQYPGDHFSLYACYANNPSFKTMVRECISRLKGRRVFQDSFIDDIVRSFEAGEQLLRPPMNMLVSVDIMLEHGIFDQD